METVQLTTEEQERAAYLAADTRAAELFARIAELEAERDALAEKLENAEAERDKLEEELENAEEAAAADSLKHWDEENGNPDDYKEFFYECFARLADYYPVPSISSDYAKSVIFEAIEKAEANGGAS